MRLSNYAQITIVALSAIGTSFAFLPYGWAHVASGAILASVGTVHALPYVAKGAIKLAAKMSARRS